MATAQQFLEKAASYIGIGGTDNIFNTWYWGYHCYDPDTYPWCACFQSYVGVHDLDMPFEPSASAAGVGWQGTRVADEDVQPGDWVLFTWDGRQDFSWADHIAVVEWSDINGSGYFGTIDGNSGGGQGVVQRNTYYNWGSYGTAFFRPPYDNGGGQPEPEPEPAPAERNRLHMIDIASWQAGIKPRFVDCDIVAIKVTGGTSYENPYWRQWADETLGSGKMLAFYHYACENNSEPGGKAEADFFWEHVKDYKGQFVPILDWEAHATNMPVSYAKSFLDRIAKLSGAVPVFYGYASNVNSTDYSSISNRPLWMASYLDKYQGAGWVDDPTQTWDTGAWDDLFAYQYTSTGDIDGYGSNLDLSIVYCTPTQWWKMCGGEAPQPGPTPTPSGDQPYYNVMCNGKWCGKMEGLHDTTGSSDDFGGIYGSAMQYLAIGGVGDYQVHDVNGNWWPKVNKYDLSDEEHGMAGAGADIDCVRIFDPSVHYQTHNKGGGWNDVMIGTHDTGGSGDDFAGQYGVPQDAIRIWRE